MENVSVDSISKDAKILDVREDYEWEAGHIDGALHIPLDSLPESLDDLDPDTDLAVICRSGGRSARATAWLESHGYSAVNVTGGMGAWLEAGKPMVSDNGQDPTVV
ncbi:rhodanese-like domain-containing protein [Arthrobacter gengyunqii]|uniref:Rhodanese-like domain-containing protein n=1 Tax=Arthrobacter gengyunqii TaxID=2886940 RepID=A0A9X1S519_9MICC|nr:rhodanese-like domain-containing protein [Arthrobacter gengyunqii]MCC3268915.1 rhodanese-like domain-containing protein [Arthrobacter gengyunqii]UOY96295.1 rhodanese-like domain-containing protein [Arthrobacter gengyunqii]